MNTKNLSPLRYPGGKASLTKVVESIIYANRLQGGVYVEPFAGGAAVALNLLYGAHVDRIVINDKDKAIYCFWKAVMTCTGELIDRIKSVPLTVAEWEVQRDVYRNPNRGRHFDLGFAAFYLNRCNRSGIIMNAGPIGGKAQAGTWKIDARFNRAELAQRIQSIADFGDRITVKCADALDLLRDIPDLLEGDRGLIYADPPYYVKGKGLYLNHYHDKDHANLAELLLQQEDAHWILTYDDVPRIRELYADLDIVGYNLRYSAHADSSRGGEVLISPRHLKITSTTLALLIPSSGNVSRKVPAPAFPSIAPI